MLDRLGPLGMSSDESGPDMAGRRYRRLDPVYRSQEVGVWVRIFDRTYTVHRLLGADDRRGRMPRLREREGEGVNRPSRNPRVPLRMPNNVYRPTWLSGQSTPFVEAVLCPDPVPYNFTIDAEFMK